MPFFLILIAAIIAVAAFNNAQGTLATQLETDIPAFGKWALAVFGVGALGWVPGMQTVSRYLLALVVVVLVVKNYTAVLAGFQGATCSAAANASANAQGSASATPATAYAANPNQPQITSAEVSGTGTLPASSSSAAAVNINANAQTAAVSPAFGVFDPTMFLAEFAAGFGGFGGVV